MRVDVMSPPHMCRFSIELLSQIREWNEPGGEYRQMGTIVDRMLRMEGIDDAIEEKLRNDRNTTEGRCLVAGSIGWTNLQGMNLHQ
ncbi:hypothetical protein BLNAU_4764 [Blattamonas nauphoetae]|uniref:Uncharacterized protein n=1 Tax=Blattamonas nauphoetae TaxID=2049346 RepID=A0ABQ9Y8Y8_9EUKA|nr:hypothetical protein BLNAU_4764 [Blattamonas nauphoetae]